MVSRRGHGQDEGSAVDPPTGRTDRADTAPQKTRQPDTHATKGTWAPAKSGGRVVSLDEDQFEALVRPLREGRRRRTS